MAAISPTRPEPAGPELARLGHTPNVRVSAPHPLSRPTVYRHLRSFDIRVGRTVKTSVSGYYWVAVASAASLSAQPGWKKNL